MIAIIDYGAGNIFSVKNALDYLGLPGELTADPEKIRKADALILPGVGAFPSAMQMLHDSGLTDVIREESHKKPFLGICLGMQLIFEKGYEFEECDGLGLVPGKVEKNRSTGHGDSAHGLEQVGNAERLSDSAQPAGRVLRVLRAFLPGSCAGRIPGSLCRIRHGKNPGNGI